MSLGLSVGIPHENVPNNVAKREVAFLGLLTIACQHQIWHSLALNDMAPSEGSARYRCLAGPCTLRSHRTPASLKWHLPLAIFDDSGPVPNSSSTTDFVQKVSTKLLYYQ